MSRVIVLGGEEGFAARINVLPGTQVVALPRDTIESERFDLLRGLDPDVLPDIIFFCEAVPSEQALELAARTDEAYPSIVLVMVGEPDAGLVLEAMRAGIRDIVPSDVGEPRLLELLRKAESQHVAVPARAELPATVSAPKECRIVTVASPKGGVGKTSISVNLALGLAQHYPNDVVIVDLDLQFGDVGSALDLTPVHTMEHALGPEAAGDTLLLKTMLTVHDSGLFVLCGSDSPAALEKATGAQITRLLHQLTSQFSYVVVDTAAGLDESTLAALESSDDVVLVSTMDVSCVRSVRKEADLLVELGLLPPSRTLALNLADKQSGLKVKDIEAVIGMPVEVVIPRSSDVQLAANHGRPLMLRGKKGGPFVKAIGGLIARLHRQGAMNASKHKRLEVA